MTCSPRGSLAVGACAVAVVATLSVVGARVSARPESGSNVSNGSLPAAAPVPPSAPAVKPSGPAELARSADSPEASIADLAAVAAAIPPAKDGGPRQRLMETRLKPLLSQPTLRAGVFGVDVRTGAFFDVDGSQPFSAASLIKIPVAIALLAEVDRARIQLAEPLTMTPADLAGGSGSLQYLPIGTRFSVERLAELMIRRSDNTATNILVQRLGGPDRLNAVWDAWGLSQTRLRTPLPDMAGTNTTSPHDLVSILDRAIRGGMLQIASRERLLSWMRRSHVRSLLPAGVGRGARVANKTGDIPGALGDAGYVETPEGDRYLLAVQVERPRNSNRAKILIRAVSKTVFESLTGLPGPPIDLERRAIRFAQRAMPRARRVKPS